MKRVLAWGLKVFVLFGLVAVTLLVGWAFQSRTMPALRLWHTVFLAEEFSADDATFRTTLADYLRHEERLFRELHRRVYDRIELTPDLFFSRYRKGGPQDPERFNRNWNRTFQLVPENIRGGVLLLHGLTDSPYSLRRIGEIFYGKEFYVLGMRLPGHGTIPGALTQVHWQDWVAATRLGARHVRKRIGPNRPLVIAGYSNGGGLAVKYALDALSDPALPRPDRLLLFSPEIGIEPLASIADSHRLLSFLPYFAKFKWLSIEPEYDPFKYNSFPKNAAQQAYELTTALHRKIKETRVAGRLMDFPPVLTFLSWIDATVKTSATIQRLYERLENEGNELVVFDVNRVDKLTMLIPEADLAPLDHLAQRSDLPFRLTIIGNAAGESMRIAERTRGPRSKRIQSTVLSLEWPRGMYSLSHVAIPFAPDDPVYGVLDRNESSYHGLPLGRLQPRGELRFLTVSLNQFMRLRSNPFFDYLERRLAAEIERSTLPRPGHGEP